MTEQMYVFSVSLVCSKINTGKGQIVSAYQSSKNPSMLFFFGN